VFFQSDVPRFRLSFAKTSGGRLFSKRGAEEIFEEFAVREKRDKPNSILS